MSHFIVKVKIDLISRYVQYTGRYDPGYYEKSGDYSLFRQEYVLTKGQEIAI